MQSTITDKGVIQEVWPGQTFFAILLEQAFEKVSKDRIHVARPLHILPKTSNSALTRPLSVQHSRASPDYHLDQLDDAVGVERGQSHIQLIQNAAKGPEV